MKWPAALTAVTIAAATIAASSCGFHHSKYENPITKDTQQPDKALYDKAIHDLEKGRYELSRLTLNTLINTYDSSEYLAKAKLAIADSWYREGGASGLAQAEAEYKDFELFYSTMPEAAEAQYKICGVHFGQMSKPDRDTNQALRAEQECKQLVLQYPNSKFVPETEQRLREIDEVLAEGEMKSADFYYQKGARAAAANRYVPLVDQYPLYSRADEALWKGADEYLGLGAKLRPRAVQALQRIVRDYPLGTYADLAKKKLRELEAEVPEPDPAAVARMKYEQENRTKPGVFRSATGFLRPGPDVSMAAKTGSPAMKAPKQSIPVNVPGALEAGAPGFQGDVTVAPVANAGAGAKVDGATASIDGAKPQDPTAAATPAATSATADPAADAKSATTNSKDKKKKDKKDNKKDTKKQDQAQSQAAAPATDSTTPKP
ncbi:MAG TPA: outer membrane protein assembly factor BamD [Bryobacteraceae bacterium]|jgi:outer membrane protein assembly factor BamD